jgi:P pilus assembly chaperone PapD
MITHVLSTALAITTATASAHVVVSPDGIELVKSPAFHDLVVTAVDGAARVRARTYEWTQRADGGMQLDATDDVTVFPAEVVLAKGGSRRIRLSSVIPTGSVERTYRVIVEELSADGHEVVGSVALPLFVRPEAVRRSAEIDLVANGATSLQITIRNKGTVWMRPIATVRALAEDDTEVFRAELDGWYVLAGTRRTYDVALPTDACVKATMIVAEAHVDGGTIEARTAIRDCAAGSVLHATPEAMRARRRWPRGAR